MYRYPLFGTTSLLTAADVFDMVKRGEINQLLVRRWQTRQQVNLLAAAQHMRTMDNLSVVCAFGQLCVGFAGIGIACTLGTPREWGVLEGITVVALFVTWASSVCLPYWIIERSREKAGEGRAHDFCSCVMKVFGSTDRAQLHISQMSEGELRQHLISALQRRAPEMGAPAIAERLENAQRFGIDLGDTSIYLQPAT